jgi:hypothetical protein
VPDSQHNRGGKLAFTKFITEGLGYLGFGYIDFGFGMFDRIVQSLCLLRTFLCALAEVSHHSNDGPERINCALRSRRALQPTVRIIDRHDSPF